MLSEEFLNAFRYLDHRFIGQEAYFREVHIHTLQLWIYVCVCMCVSMCVSMCVYMCVSACVSTVCGWTAIQHEGTQGGGRDRVVTGRSPWLSPEVQTRVQPH